MKRQWQLSVLPDCSRTAIELRTPDDRTEVPVTVIKGKPGNTVVLIVAGIHGDEYEGPAAIHEVTAGLNCDEARGSILFVPVANPAAFAAATRLHPFDQGDLNRSFPGRPNGSPTSQLAWLLFQELVLKADAVLTLHGWSKQAAVVPYVEYSVANSGAAYRSRDVARALDFVYIHPYHWPNGVLGAALADYDIPVVEAEVGGCGTITDEGVFFLRSVIRRFLSHFGVLPAEMPQAREPIFVQHTEVRAAHSGLFRSFVPLGQAVLAGQRLGMISKIDGKLVQAVHAPCDGVVAVSRTLASVQKDDLLFQLFFERGPEQHE